MKRRILIAAFILSACIGQLKAAEAPGAIEERLSFRGKEAEFDLAAGQRARIVEGEIGTMEIQLLSATAEGAEILFVSPRKESKEKLNAGQEINFLTGGLEQTGALKLLALKDASARFKIEFGSAPPAPEISDDMPIEIIYLK